MTTKTPVKVERLQIRVKRYTITKSLARHIYFVDELYVNGEENTIGVTNCFDSVLMITQPYRNIHMKIDYIIEEMQQKEFNEELNALKTISNENSMKFIFKGGNTR